MPFRFVGSHEYLQAMNNLDRLIRMSSPAEIEIYDKIISQQDEFSFQSGATIANLNSDKYSKFGAPRDRSVHFKRHSLAWMVALARIELGATVSMYSDVPSPFEFVAPIGYGTTEYVSLLNDDLATHLTALRNDPMLETKAKRNSEANSETVAYLRRLKIVNDMLLAAKSTVDGTFNQSANEKLAVVHRYRKKLSEKVEQAQMDVAYTTTRQTERTQTSIEFDEGSVRSVSPIVSSCQRNFLRRANQGNNVRPTVNRSINRINGR